MLQEYLNPCNIFYLVSLLSYKNADIFDLDNDFEKVEYEDTEIVRTYKMFLDVCYFSQHNFAPT